MRVHEQVWHHGLRHLGQVDRSSGLGHWWSLLALIALVVIGDHWWSSLARIVHHHHPLCSGKIFSSCQSQEERGLKPRSSHNLTTLRAILSTGGDHLYSVLGAPIHQSRLHLRELSADNQHDLRIANCHFPFDLQK